MNHFHTFENWTDSQSLTNFNDKTDVLSNTIKCDVCKAVIPNDKDYEHPFICDACEDKGWYIDPAGGIHYQNDDDESEDDFEDPVAMYEKIFNEFYDVAY